MITSIAHLVAASAFGEQHDSGRDLRRGHLAAGICSGLAMCTTGGIAALDAQIRTVGEPAQTALYVLMALTVTLSVAAIRHDLVLRRRWSTYVFRCATQHVTRTQPAEEHRLASLIVWADVLVCASLTAIMAEGAWHVLRPG